ncbi:probable RNA methyltransferase CG11342 [Neocloeon triangulifer]|uniref:probable RNA methyltransferase CG11342 n=1 Tax=Neocloeon triangulifer TaxID=2078957 RepID=UPI00286F4F99|nr:probable RNA methyltransferase CG11342 [Neocloeon triangulifer]
MSSDSNLDFVGDNPGAVRHGNFINYYQFHPASERIEKLPTDIWRCSRNKGEKFVCLDIGCNTGDLTEQVLNFLKENLTTDDGMKPEIHMVGIDLDQNLISRANEKFNSTRDLEFLTIDAAKETLDSLLKIALSHDVPKFGAVFLMSVTMWVHLVNGDEAFQEFLKKSGDLTDRWLVIESQPWKCYRSAQRRLVSSGEAGFEFYSKLTIKGDKIQPFVDKVLSEECGMSKVFETDPSKWNRTICIYKKR